VKKGKVTARINKKGSIDITIAFKNCQPVFVDAGKYRVLYRLVTSKMKAPFEVEVAAGVTAQPLVICEVVIPIRGGMATRIKNDRILRQRKDQEAHLE
jgi:hypothetical protein